MSVAEAALLTLELLAAWFPDCHVDCDADFQAMSLLCLLQIQPT
jgi:hypothetical protein